MLLLQKKYKQAACKQRHFTFFYLSPLRVYNLKMSKAFKKKKQQSSASDLRAHLNFLLGSQVAKGVNSKPVVLQRSLILKSAMFWDSRNRIEKIKSLVLSDMQLQQFDDVEEFKISELTSISQLSLSKNRIVHLQPIGVLDTLVTLNISHNKVYNISPLEALVNLEELYASNNLISNIDSLKSTSKLRILNVFRNKIANIESTLLTLQILINLEDLDIEENPFYNEQIRVQLVNLPISRLNDQLIPKSQKQSRVTTNSSFVNMSSSCLINPLNLSMMRDTKTSFFNVSSKSIKKNKIKQLKDKLQGIQDQYSKIDDEFQEQIVRNVQLKSEFCRLSQQMKQKELQKEENQYKVEQIKLLKRKAKALKEDLFTKDRKGELLRKIFELQTQALPKRQVIQKPKNQVVWVRKFDSDDEIIIADDSKYLEEDAELDAILNSNSSTLQELRKQLQSLY